MAVPKKQLTDLRGRLIDHKKRIRELNKQVAILENEIQVHETIVALLNDRKVLTALGELFDDQPKAQGLVGKEISFAKRAGIKLPPGAKLSFGGGPRGSLRVRLDVPNQGGVPYSLQWDSVSGFGPASAA
jgi:hypothetical protein